MQSLSGAAGACIGQARPPSVKLQDACHRAKRPPSGRQRLKACRFGAADSCCTIGGQLCSAVSEPWAAVPCRGRDVPAPLRGVPSLPSEAARPRRALPRSLGGPEAPTAGHSSPRRESPRRARRCGRCREVRGKRVGVGVPAQFEAYQVSRLALNPRHRRLRRVSPDGTGGPGTPRCCEARSGYGPRAALRACRANEEVPAGGRRLPKAAREPREAGQVRRAARGPYPLRAGAIVA
jgi:hypothetical protein